MECDECEYRLKCNIRRIKEMKESAKKVKALFRNRLAGKMSGNWTGGLTEEEKRLGILK